MTYFQDDDDKHYDWFQLIQRKIAQIMHLRSNTHSRKYQITDIARIMGIDEAGNSSKTLDFLIYCNDNGTAGITQDDRDDDVNTTIVTTSEITETMASNGTIQGRLHQH